VLILESRAEMFGKLEEGAMAWLRGVRAASFLPSSPPLTFYDFITHLRVRSALTVINSMT
jgi:hypothetical protein